MSGAWLFSQAVARPTLTVMVGRPKTNTRYSLQNTKFDDCSFSRSRDITGVVKF